MKIIDVCCVRTLCSLNLRSPLPFAEVVPSSYRKFLCSMVSYGAYFPPKT